VQTGEAVYHLCEKAGEASMDWYRASASMPLAARMVEIDGRNYLDGGIADSIPLKAFEQLGYERNVVILTQPEGFQKRPNKLLPLLRRAYRRHPKLVDALARRHEVYNEALAYVKQQETQSKALVIRPEAKLPIGHTCHDPEQLKTVYQMGRETAAKRLDEVRAFLKG
jgi:predicted patatin/cPLA2 family phospholipase